MVKADTTHDLTRIVRQYKPRVTAFYDRQNGVVSLHGRSVPASAQASINQLLMWTATATGESRPRVIYVTGGATAGDIPGHAANDPMAVEDFWSAPIFDGWRITSWHRDPWKVAYERNGIQVDVAMSANWYGDEHSAPKCDAAHIKLAQMLRETFDSHASLMGSPGRTGADLLQRTLPEGVRYPRLTEDVRYVLEHNFGQGRIEQPGLYQPMPDGKAPGVYVLDARWMYAAALRHLPIGPVEWNRDNPEYKGYRKAVYRITTRVPEHWDHIGLCPIWSPNDDRTVWPKTPGTQIKRAWLTGAELAVLYDYDWPVLIDESIVFAPEDAPGHDPARHWITKMMALRGWAELNSDALITRACRHIVIDAIGYLHRGHQVEVRYVADASALPRDVLTVLQLRNSIRYTIQSSLNPTTDVLYRPEWATQVWGSSRAKLERMALTFPSRDVMWLRHDSVVLPYDPRLADNGKVGAWRIKKAHTEPVEPPLTEAAYRQLMTEAD